MSIHIQLYSAGVDSFIGYHYLKEKLGQPPHTIYFNLNHKYNREEILTIIRSIPNTEIINNVLQLGLYENFDAHIPYRNVLLITTIAAKYAYIKDDVYIYINCMADDRVSDQGKEFIKEMNELVNRHTINAKFHIQSSMPLDWTKFDAVEWFVTKYPKELLESHTFSCYNPNNGRHCYSCNACFRRNTLLYHVGIKKPFYNHELIMKYKRNIGKYPKKRQDAMKRYIEFLTKGC